jgi:hypothetical protein
VTKHKLVRLSPALLLVLGFYAWRTWHNRFGELPYRGQNFKLAHMYWSWEGYKSDPEIAPDQLAAAQKAVETGPLTPVYPDRWSMIQGTGDLDFPGFGMAVFGERPQADGSVLAGIAVSVPQANKDRVVVYRGRNGKYTLVDDFVWSPEGAIMGVRDKDGKLEYSALDGGVVVVREAR